MKLKPYLACALLYVGGILGCAHPSNREVSIALPAGPHPRIYLSAQGWAELRARLKSGAKEDGDLRWLHAQLSEHVRSSMQPGAPGFLELRYELTKNDAAPTIRPQVNLILSRVPALAGLLRLDTEPGRATADVRADPRFRQALKDLLIVSGDGFHDWNSRNSFLDTAEMTHAVSIGYDWLYEWLTDEERKTIHDGLVNKGLSVSFHTHTPASYWRKLTNNWAEVTRASLTIGAFAVADTDPQLASRILTEAEKKLAETVQSYSPDGGWAEGQNYWNYATQYLVAYLSAYKTAFGKDSALSKVPGVSETAFFEIYNTSTGARSPIPNGDSFNFSDHGGLPTISPHSFWLARQFECQTFAEHELRELNRHPENVSFFHVLWAPGAGKNHCPKLAELPLARAFRGINVATLRSSWTDPNATFVGFKGGAPKVLHGHLDHGTFVIDSQGERWALDFGKDSYSLPGYFETKKGRRWDYYRNSTAGHNTLAVDYRNQAWNAVSPILVLDARPDFQVAIADLTDIYPRRLKSAKRGLALLKGKQIVIQDEIKPIPGFLNTVTWHFHTTADIVLNGSAAHLRQNGKDLFLTITSPKDAKFIIGPAHSDYPPGQDPNYGVSDLLISLNVPANSAETLTLSVVASPTRGQAPKLGPLEKWSQARLPTDGSLTPLAAPEPQPVPEPAPALEGPAPTDAPISPESGETNG